MRSREGLIRKYRHYRIAAAAVLMLMPVDGHRQIHAEVLGRSPGSSQVPQALFFHKEKF